MKNCRKYEDFLSRFFHGELLLHEKEDLEGHLAVCAACERLYREASEVDRVLRDLPDKLIDPPSYLRARILANLPETGPVPAWPAWTRWAGVLGGALAAMLAAVVLFRGDIARETRIATAPAPAPGPAAAGPKPATAAPSAAAAAPTAPRKSGRAGTVVASAAGVRVIREVKIYFYYPPAEKVAVTGDFNGWDAQGVALKSAGKPGLWTATLRLPPGAYSYNFIVDGDVLVPDPDAPNQMPDGYGGTNSILLVKEGTSG